MITDRRASSNERGQEQHMADSGYRQTISHPGLPSFLWTQFLGAFNDNLFKIVVSMLAVQAAAGSRLGRRAVARGRGLHPAVPAVFRICGSARRRLQQAFTVLIVTKSLEIVAAGLGLIAFLFGHLELTYAVLFLIALQATFFSPGERTEFCRRFFPTKSCRARTACSR